MSAAEELGLTQPENEAVDLAITGLANVMGYCAVRGAQPLGVQTSLSIMSASIEGMRATLAVPPEIDNMLEHIEGLIDALILTIDKNWPNAGPDNAGVH